jgi:Xaa-Pro aminopeptidase
VSPTRLAKAIKNPVEVAHIREAHVKDGVAETRFMYWLKQRVAAAKAAGSTVITDEEGNPLTEISASDRLEAFRAEQENFMGLSFDTIAGFGPHGAIIHYSATPETDAVLHTDDFFLVDSGAQYLEGTTDITRTFVLGEVDAQHKKHFTMVLRGHLNLGAACFKHGTCGANLDYLTREPLWRENMDYNHGTGHGVGYLLNVHEGPNSIHWQVSPTRTSSTVLEAGMLTSNEPGLYLEGKYGIRHENLVLCCEGEKNSYGQFLHFDTVTLVPFDLDGVEVSDLNETERRELNDYHAMVYEKIAPFLNEEERTWLAQATRAI